MTIYPPLELEAARRLLVAIIRQAVKDYRAMERRGLIIRGRVAIPANCRRLNAKQRAALSLVSFFQAGGAMDHLLAAGWMPVRGKAIRQRLGVAKRTAPAPAVPVAIAAFVLSESIPQIHKLLRAGRLERAWCGELAGVTVASVKRHIHRLFARKPHAKKSAAKR